MPGGRGETLLRDDRGGHGVVGAFERTHERITGARDHHAAVLGDRVADDSVVGGEVGAHRFGMVGPEARGPHDVGHQEDAERFARHHLVAFAGDLPIEAGDGLRGLGPDFVEEERAVGLERAQRIGASTGVGERSHQERTRTVAERFGLDERVDRRDRGGPLAGADEQLGEIFGRTGTELGESTRLARGPALVGELVVGLAAPECEGRLERRPGGGGVGGTPRVGHELLEPERIDVVAAELVPRGRRDEDVESDDPAEAAHRRAERAGGEVEVLREGVGRDDGPGPTHEEAHQAPLGDAAQTAPAFRGHRPP